MSEDPVVLRPVTEADLSMIEQFLTDPEASGPFQWYGWGDPGRVRRQWAENGLLSDGAGRLTVAAGAEQLGFVAWRKVNTARNFCWNIGAQLVPEARGRGVGTQAQRLLVRYLFAHSPVVRIEADTEADNFAEQRALEKSGFTREGVMRSFVFRDGWWRDVVRYSVLRDDLAADEPPKLRATQAARTVPGG
ncbi:GNAT family protein [Streptomyces sp. SID3343]|uniref:GNAT family N-acetyltransferase n=1 Tax=Streptomyces sp. SID3343 TaxID=2690260 RepID=UPI00136892F1|nr:GNAT family protein [Streptomyces sp. SID3343]MYW02983.1 GNAT family N-acetyltransferase [Streptomyces sp. SID3343]